MSFTVFLSYASPEMRDLRTKLVERISRDLSCHVSLAVDKEFIEHREICSSEYLSNLVSQVHTSDVIVAFLPRLSVDISLIVGMALAGKKGLVIIADRDTEVPSEFSSLCLVRVSDDVDESATDVILAVERIKSLMPPPRNLLSSDVRQGRLEATLSNQDYLDSLDSSSFEEILADWFRQKEFLVTKSKDEESESYDLLLQKTGMALRIVVQIKKLTPQSFVSLQYVRELIESASRAGATGGMIISTSGFTSAAFALAKRSNPKIELLTIKDLLSYERKDDPGTLLLSGSYRDRNKIE